MYKQHHPLCVTSSYVAGPTCIAERVTVGRRQREIVEHAVAVVVVLSLSLSLTDQSSTAEAAVDSAITIQRTTRHDMLPCQLAA